MILRLILGGLSAIGLGLILWQWVAGRRFPLHRRVPVGPPFPAVTVLKPLRGADGETAGCLESWLTQEYRGPWQTLFGVATESDPAAGVVRELLARHPEADARLVICPERLGANGKVSTLVQLEREARHEMIVISDGDVWAPADLLAQLVTRLREPNVGLAHCFYRFSGARNWGMRWEALAVNADFWSQVLQSRSLWPLDFALGAALATNRFWLGRIGGLSALADHLADDFQLGHSIARAGGRIECCPLVVECREAPRTWREVWNHQLRWARTIRVCRPVPYFFSVLSHTMLWPTLWVLIEGGGRLLPAGEGDLDRSRSLIWALAVWAVCFGARWWAGRDLQVRLGVPPAERVGGWFLWVKDLLGTWIWAAAFLGRTVEWHGERFQVRRDGRLD